MSVFAFTNAQKTLALLAANPGQHFSVSEIREKTGLSKPGIHAALRQLKKEHLVSREEKSNLFLFSVNHTHPLTRQYKTLLTVSALVPLVARLKSRASKVVLFGSAARGEDTDKSDIDLLVVAAEDRELASSLPARVANRRLQVIVKTPVQYQEMAAKGEIFFQETDRGITLWESAG